MVIYTQEILDEAFILQAIRDKLSSNHHILRLQNYYEGVHDILLRARVPDQPNNKIIANYCRTIADFLTAYLVGVPIEYTAPQIVTDLFKYNDNDDVTQSITLSMNIAGFGAELMYIDEDSIPRFNSVEPREVIFIFDGTIEQNMRAAIRVYPKDEPTEGFNVTVYDNEYISQYDLSYSVGELDLIGAERHFFQDVPLIYYQNGDFTTGSFEGIITLQNALNSVLSDELNDFESFVDSYLVLEGMSATNDKDIAKMKRDRVLLTDPDSKAYWLTKTVNNQHIKDLKTDLTARIRELGRIPDVEELGSFGSSGIALQFKLINSEMQASKQERVLTKGIQRKLELLYNILRMTDASIGDYTDVKVKFQRNFIMLAAQEEKALQDGMTQDEVRGV